MFFKLLTCIVRIKKKKGRHFSCTGVLHRRKSHTGLEQQNRRVNVWRQYFHFWVNYSSKYASALNKCEVSAHNNSQQRSRLLSGHEIMKRVIMGALYLVKNLKCNSAWWKHIRKFTEDFLYDYKKTKNRWKAWLNQLKEAHWLCGGGRWEECSRAVTILFSYYYVSINCLSSRQCTIERSVLIMYAYRSLKLNIAYKQL